MILEIAQIEVRQGMEAQFEAGVGKATPVFRRAKGCKSLQLVRSVEKPRRYRLFIEWETLENHTVDFRGSADHMIVCQNMAFIIDENPRTQTPDLPAKLFRVPRDIEKTAQKRIIPKRHGRAGDFPPTMPKSSPKSSASKSTRSRKSTNRNSMHWKHRSKR